MNCKAYRDEIDAAEREASVSAATERHLAHCDACRAFRGERAALRRLVGSLESVAAPADFEFRLRAAMRAEGRGPRGGFVVRLFKPLPAALAACAAVAFTLAYLRLPVEAPRPDRAGVTASETSSPAAPTPAETAARASQTAAASEQGSVRADEEAVAAVETKRPAQTRPAALRSIAKQTKGAKAVEGVTDFVQTRADVKTRLTDDPAEVAMSNPPVGLSASRKPMRVVLRNERGASRVVSMRPVSFGSQEFLGRLTNSFSASNTRKEVVW